MPRSATPRRQVQQGPRGRTPPARDVGGGASRSAGPSCAPQSLADLRATVKRQGEVIEKQGALLLGHSQLLHEMREELLAMRGGGGGGGVSDAPHHAQQLSQLTSRTLHQLTTTLEQVEKNVGRLAAFTQCPLEEAPPATPRAALVSPEEFHDISISDADTVAPAPPASFSKQAAAALARLQQPAAEQRRGAWDDVSSNGRDIGTDLYARGMAQKKKREHEIAERQRVEEEEDRRQMRVKPEILRRSRSTDKTMLARSEEWREKRERKRESLRYEMQRLEQQSLRPAPTLNPRSVRLAARRPSTAATSQSPPRSCDKESQKEREKVVERSPFTSPYRSTPCRSPSVADMSPPPLDEVLERLRKRREMLGLASSESPDNGLLASPTGSLE